MVTGGLDGTFPDRLTSQKVDTSCRNTSVSLTSIIDFFLHHFLILSPSVDER